MSEQMPTLFDVNVGELVAQPSVEVFTQLKGEFEHMSEEATIINLGKLSDLMPRESFKGSISVQERLARGVASPEGLVTANEALHKSYVPAIAGASVRCVDGRANATYDDNDIKSYKLGPQVQGGTPDIAVARRLRIGVDTGVTLEADVDNVTSIDSKFLPAGHTDDHVAEGEYGCGALKGQEVKLGYYADQIEAINAVTKAIIEMDGKTLPVDFAETLATNASDLQDVASEYFAGKPDILNYLTKFNSEAKRTKRGQHNEFKVVLNFVRDTTLNSGKLNNLTGGEYNAFNLDVWYVLDTYGEDAPYIIADALATLMNLTDGSLDVEARLPAENAAPVAA